MSGRPPGRRIALVLAYDGARYGGSQVQPRHSTIQGELETAIAKLTGEQLRIAFAGRTDAGVHALGQVAAFTTASALKTGVFVQGLNARLPADIAVQRAVEAPQDFAPRRHAAGRWYRYTIYNAPVRSPLWRHRAWHVAEKLDTERMRKAASTLIGEHDFAAFSRREGVTTVRRLRRCDITRDGPLLTLEMEGNAFLRQQVRRTAGALVEVGMGKLNLRQFRALLRHAEPNSAGPVAPACGVCLVAVDYPGLDLGPPHTLS